MFSTSVHSKHSEFSSAVDIIIKTLTELNRQRINQGNYQSIFIFLILLYSHIS